MPKHAKKVRPIKSVIENTLVVIFLAYVASFTLAPFVIGGTSFTIYSGSMTPSLGIGDVIISDDVDPSTLRSGDVITYMPDDTTRTNGLSITHRIESLVYTDGELTQIITKGDANPVADDPIRPDQVVAKMVYSVPYAGYPRMVLTQGLGAVVSAR